MNTSFSPLRARAVLIFYAALAIAGLVPVLYCLGLVVWHHSFAFIPELVFAFAGLGITAVGILSALRQIALLRARRQRNEDRLRRVDDYRRDDGQADAPDGRREPFISSYPATPAPRRAGARG